MPLCLYYAESLPFQIEVLLQSLRQGTVSSLDQPPFRIVTPDETSCREIEHLWLESESLAAGLAGRPVLSLDALAQGLLSLHPTAMPLASPALQRKALRRALKKQKGLASLTGAEEILLLEELALFRNFMALAEAVPGRHPAFELERQFQSVLRDAFEHCIGEGARQEVWNLWGCQAGELWPGVRDIYFLGFFFPDAALVSGLDRLATACPFLNLHIFFPPRETLIDPEGLLYETVRKFENHASDICLLRGAFSPVVRLQPSATPLHESRQLFAAFQQDPLQTLIFSPERADVAAMLRSRFFRLQGFDRDLAEDPLALASLWRTLEAGCRPELDEKSRFHFAELKPHLFDKLAAWQRADGVTLRAIARMRRCLAERERAELIDPVVQNLGEWIADLASDDAMSANDADASLWMPVATLSQVRMRPREIVCLSAMNQKFYPLSGLRLLPRCQELERLFMHRQKLALAAAASLARRELRLSFSDFSLEGRPEWPSTVLKMFAWQQEAESDFSLPRSSEAGHPYFSENVGREQARKQKIANNRDAGFVVWSSPNALRETLRARPVSARYVDQYARCPWKGFASWLLKLDERREDEFEMSPKDQGRLMHRLLENIFRRLIEKFFSELRLPEPGEVEAVFASCQSDWRRLASEEFTALAPLALEDRLDKISVSVRRLLRAEESLWRESEYPMLPHALEWRFGYPGTPFVSYPLDGHGPVPLAGSVDRIDLSEDHGAFLLVDYKTSGSAELARRLRAGTSFQLWIYLYAVRQSLFKTQDQVGAVYWDAKTLTKNQGIVRHDLYSSHHPSVRKTRSYMAPEAFAELEAQFHERFASLLSCMLKGDYPLDPPDCLGSYCEYREICRYERRELSP